MAALLQRLGRVFSPIWDPLSCLPPSPELWPLERQSASALLRQLDARLRRTLSSLEVGERDSLRKGQGLDFAELREYQPGDDIRKMDWNVLARTLTPHVREYLDEKRQTFWLAADCTASMRFGRTFRKVDSVTALAGYIGLLAQQAGHRLGAVLMTDKGNEIIPPQLGEVAIRQLLARLLTLSDPSDASYKDEYLYKQSLIRTSPETPQTPASEPAQSSQSLPDPLELAAKQLLPLANRQSLVFILSDFLPRTPVASRQPKGDERMTLPEWARCLGRLSRQAALIYMPVTDPVEMALPPKLGLLPVVDPETGEALTLDTDDPAFRQAYEADMAARQAHLHGWLNRTGRLVPVSTEEEPLAVLKRLLKGSPERQGGL